MPSQQRRSSVFYWVNVLLTMLAPIFWGTTYIVTTEYLPESRPLFAALIRVLPAGIILMFFVRRMPRIEEWKPTLILSFLNISLFQTLLFIAAYRLPGGVAAAISSIQPFFIMLLLWKIDRIAPHLITLFAVIATVIGMSMLLITSHISWDWLGIIAAFCGAVSMGMGIYLTKRWQPEVSNLTFTSWQLLFGGIMLLPFALIFEPYPNSMTIENVVGYAYLTIFGSLISYVLFFRGIKYLSAVAVSILGTLSPITATIIGWSVLDQSLSPSQSIGFFVVLISVLIVQITTKRG